MTELIEQGGHDVVTYADGLQALACITENDDVPRSITSTQPLNITGIEFALPPAS